MQAAQLFRRSGGPDIVFPDDRVRIAVIVGARHDVISVVGCDDDDNDLERAGEAPGVALRGFERHGLSPVRSRSEEHTSELQSLMLTSYAVLCLNKKMSKSDESNPAHESLVHKK